jgi:WD40 repeat protein
VIPFLLWSLAGMGASAQAVKPFPRIETGGHSATVRRIDVDAAERFLVSASDDKTARVWDLRTGRLLKILRPPIGDGDEGKLYAVAVSPDGATVAVGGFTGPPGTAMLPIYIFDRESGAIRRTTASLPEVTNHLAYSKNGRYLAAALGSKNGIRIFETDGYTQIARDEEYASDCYWVEFDQSARLVTASWDGFLRLYDAAFHLLRKVKTVGGAQPFSARFSPDGKLIAVGFADGMAVDIISGTELSVQYELQTPPGRVNDSSALWSEDGRTVCAAGRYNRDSVHPILCWDQLGKGQRNTFPVASDTVLDLQALRDGEIAFCSADGSVGVLDRNGTVRWRSSLDLLQYRAETSSLHISADGGNVDVAANYFNGMSRTRHNVSFSVSDQKLEIDPGPQSTLNGPITSGLAIERWEDDEHPTLDGHALPLDDYEISRSLAIAPGKGSFVLGSDFSIRKFDHQGKLLWIAAAPGVARQVNISADRRFVVAGLGDGTIRWYAFENGDEVLALFVNRDLRRWVAWTPDGFFNFQNGGDGLIGYQVNRGRDHEGEFVKVDQLREVFYQRDLVAQILTPGGIAALVAARNRVGDVSGILSGGLPPEIELISPADATVAGDYLLQFRVKEKGGGRGRVVYRIDGAEIEGRAAVDVHGTAADTNARYFPIAGGTHTLTVAVYDAKGKIEGAPQTMRITRTLPALGSGSNLYVVAAGISHYSDNSLSSGVKFAARDAELVAARFREQKGRGLFRNVDALSLSDGKATFSNIQAEVARVAKTVQPGDTFILYLAGHGVAVDGEYYFIPWEAEYTNEKALLAKSMNREQIQALLKQIPTNKSVLILDTCGAGGYLESRGPGEKAAIEKVGLISGRAVLAASNSNEMAMDGYQNHGVFTYALLEGLQQADGTAQGEILITRLAEYVQTKVPLLTLEKWKYRQAPLSRVDGEPFPIARKAVN